MRIIDISPNRLDRLSLLVSIAIALWMTVLTLAPHSSFRPLHIIFHYALLPFLLGVHFCLRWKATGIFPFRSFSWPDLSMALYLALTLVSYFLATKNGSVALHFLAVYRNILVPFAVFWLIRISRLGNNQIRIWVPVMALLSVINIFICLFAWLKPEYLPSIWPALLSDKGEIRITGTFTNADIFAGAVALYSSFILHDAIHRRNGAYRLLLMSIYFLSILCICLTFSRTSWIGLVFLLLITGVLYGRSLARLDLLGLLPSFLLLMVIFAIPPKILVEQQKITPEVARDTMGQKEKPKMASERAAATSQIDQTNISKMVSERVISTSQIRSRILTAYAGLRMFYKRPIWGWGYETYSLHAKNFVEPIGPLQITEYESEKAPSHNTFITILAETGILGLFLYTFPLVWWGLLAVRNRHLYMGSLHSQSFLNSRFFIILWANLIFILLISQSIDIRFFPFALVQIWLNLGLISNLIQPDREP